MVTLKNSHNLSKNNMIVYEIFNLNPFKTFDVNELIETINKYNQVISRRTVFRAVKNLKDIGAIYCCNSIKGTRKFQLLKNNYYVLVCEKCGGKKIGKIKNLNFLKEILVEDHCFSIKKIEIEIVGICEKCRKKNNKTY